MVNATLANFDPLTLTWWARGPAYGADAAATNVSCLSPPRADARPLGLEVSLNGQQYTLDSFGFVRCTRRTACPHTAPCQPDAPTPTLVGPTRPVWHNRWLVMLTGLVT